MNIDDLKLFIEVARQGGFAAAARARNIDPSAISRSIAGLEDRVGVRLFQRTTRKIALTEAGALFFARVSVLIDDLEASVDDAKSIAEGPVGTLRMTASNAFGPTCIAPLLPQFQELYPKLTLELVLSDENLDLVAQRIDLAIRLGPAGETGLEGVKLFDTHYRVCASPSYLSRAPQIVGPMNLAEHRCLLFPFEEFRTRWTFRSLADDTVETVSVHGNLITSSALTLKACALAGMGPSLLPNWLVDDDIAKGTLINLFAGFQITATSVETAAWLLYPSRTYIPGKVKAMTDFLMQRLGKQAHRDKS